MSTAAPPRKEDLLSKATTELGPCQVRSETDCPCQRPATVEIFGVLFCERCAREQEAYFAIGKLAQRPPSGRATQARDLRNEPLVETLDRVRREHAGLVAKAVKRCKKPSRPSAAGQKGADTHPWGTSWTR